MLCPIKPLGLEQCGLTELGDLSCNMKAETSDRLLTNEREGEVIYGTNGEMIPCFLTEMLLNMPSRSSPSAQHQLDICLQSLYYINTPGHCVTNTHTFTHSHTHTHAIIMSVTTLNHCTDHVLSFQSFLGISQRSYVTTPPSPDRMQLHKKAIGSEAILKRQLRINRL